MGLPALLGELDQEVVQAAAAIPSEGRAQAPIEELAESTKLLEHIQARAKPILDEIFTEVEKLTRAVGADAGEPMDQAIERVNARETALKEKFLPMIKAARELRAKSFGAQRLSREERARHAVVLDRYLRALGAILKLFRDGRWRMMALRAEVEPAGDAPVFSDPHELLEYLQADRK